MEQIISFLETVKLARKQVYQNLTIFPLLAPDGVEPDYGIYALLQQAQHSGLFLLCRSCRSCQKYRTLSLKEKGTLK